MKFLVNWGWGEIEVVEAETKWDVLKKIAEKTLSPAANKAFNWVLIATSDFKECMESFNAISTNGEIRTLYQLGETLFSNGEDDEDEDADNI